MTYCRALVLGLLLGASATAFACGEDAAAGPVSADSGTKTASGAEAGVDGSRIDATSPSLPALQAVTRLQYTQKPFAATGCFWYSSVTADLDASTMTVATCADAGGASDAGTTERSVSLTPADVSALRALVLALREDTANADAGCSGFDGTSHVLLVTVPERPAGIDVRHEYVCSGKRPDLRVEREGFLALREKLHQLAGLDTTYPPT